MDKENDIISARQSNISTPQQIQESIDIGLKNPEIKVAQNRAERITALSNETDFGVPNIVPIDSAMKESNFVMSSEEADEFVRTLGIKKGVGDQISASLENVLTSIGGIGDQTRLVFGNVANYVSGGTIGKDLQDTAFRSLEKRYADMSDTEMAVGGIRSELVSLIGGSASFLELALVGLASGGYGALAQIAIQSQGEGTYNDIEAYAELHGGDISEYTQSGFDIAANTANSLLQVATERLLGVGSPRFLKGASRGLFVEGVSGFLQEGVQGALMDLNEVVKGNQELSVLAENADEYLRDAIIGGILQGAMGAATYHKGRVKADNQLSQIIAKVRNHKTPTKDDKQFAKQINDAKETGYAVSVTEEFKNRFDASTGAGKLQNKIATELKNYADKAELDFDIADETELAQRIEQIATIETVNALYDAEERGISILDHELNNIKYTDGKLWLAGENPTELGVSLKPEKTIIQERIKQATPEYIAKKSAKEEKQKNIEAINAQKERIQKAKLEKEKAKAEKAEAQLQTEKAKTETAKAKKQIAKIKQLQTVEKAQKELLMLKKMRAENEAQKAKQINVKETQKQQEQKQSSVTGKSKSPRGSYNDVLKYMVLNSNADLSTISHEFAHYWMNNNFKWARSGLASKEWLKRWRAVERSLGIMEGDKYLSANASERFAKSYEAWILKGEQNEELAWAFQGLRKLYLEIYDELETEYFDWKDGLKPEVVDWFNRQLPQTFEQSVKESTKVLNDIVQGAGATVATPISDGVVLSDGKEETIGINKETVSQSKLAVKGDKKTQSKLQNSLKKQFGEKVQVDNLETINKAETVENALKWIESDREGAWNAMIDPATNKLDRATLYNAFVRVAGNDADLMLRLAENKELAKEARELGQAVAMLDIRSESGFDVVEIIQNAETAKGNLTESEYNSQIDDSGVFEVELTEQDQKELESEVECKL